MPVQTAIISSLIQAGRVTPESVAKMFHAAVHAKKNFEVLHKTLFIFARRIQLGILPACRKCSVFNHKNE